MSFVAVGFESVLGASAFGLESFDGCIFRLFLVSFPLLLQLLKSNIKYSPPKSDKSVMGATLLFYIMSPHNFKTGIDTSQRFIPGFPAAYEFPSSAFLVPSTSANS